jgi:hypothetical protein
VRVNSRAILPVYHLILLYHDSSSSYSQYHCIGLKEELLIIAPSDATRYLLSFISRPVPLVLVNTRNDEELELAIIVVKGSHIARHYLLNAPTTFRDLGIGSICTGEISATNSRSSCEKVTKIINRLTYITLRTHMASDWIRVFRTAFGGCSPTTWDFRWGCWYKKTFWTWCAVLIPFIPVETACISPRVVVCHRIPSVISGRRTWKLHLYSPEHLPQFEKGGITYSPSIPPEAREGLHDTKLRHWCEDLSCLHLQGLESSYRSVHLAAHQDLGS